jgi:uncharacterized OsmC-like protein
VWNLTTAASVKKLFQRTESERLAFTEHGKESRFQNTMIRALHLGEQETCPISNNIKRNNSRVTSLP